MAKSFLKLDTRRPLADGTYPVKIAVGYGTNIYLSTGISLKAADWDDKTSTCVGKYARRINESLETLASKINLKIIDLRDSGIFAKLSNSEIKDILTSEDGKVRETKKEITLGDMFEKVIATKNARNAQLFSATLKKLKNFKDPYSVTFGMITKMWLMSFYVSMQNLSVNTRAIHMRNLRNVVNYAIDEGITQLYPFRNYRIPTQETEMRVLSIDKLRYIRDCPHLGKYDSEHRDMFMLMFYLIGINIADLSALTASSYKDGRIEYRRAKTGKLYSIKVEPEAASIIDKYRGKKHLLSCFDRYKSYKDYAQHLNDSIRRIGPIKTENGTELRTANHYLVMDPLEPRLTSYWARYTWATTAAELDIPKDTISESLGHEYGSKITGVYIKYSRDKIDAANRKVLDYLNEKG